jgi:hypothetical protein
VRPVAGNVAAADMSRRTSRSLRIGNCASRYLHALVEGAEVTPTRARPAPWSLPRERNGLADTSTGSGWLVFLDIRCSVRMEAQA